MPDVMRDDSVRLASHREFKKELISWVREERPYPEVNIRLATCEAEGVEDSLHHAFRNLQTLRLALSDSLVFEYQRH